MTRTSTWLLVVGLCAVSFVGTVGSLALSPFLPELSAELGISIALLGQLPAITMITATGLGLVLGPIADSVGLERVLMAGIVSVGLAALLFSFASAYPWLILAAIAAAVGRATALPVGYAIAGTRLPGDQARRAISGILAAAGVSFIVGLPLLTWIASRFGWRAAFGAIVIMAILSAALLLRAPPGERPTARLARRPLVLLKFFLPLLKDRSLVGIYIESLTRTGTGWLVLTYLGAFLVNVKGLDLPSVGLAFAALGAGQVLGSALAGGRAGVLPLRPLIACMVFLWGLLAGAAYWLDVSAVACAGLLTLGLVANGVCEVSEATLLARESSAGQGTTMTLLGSFTSLGAGLGAGLGGLLYALGGFPLLALAGPLVGLAGALSIWLLRRPVPAPASAPAPVTS